ncbi:flagellar biosynthesis protein FliR [Pseudoruegeria sp. SK021]|nr:flagellar biosynthesis protein FliR [Pseudoruegeria sp. SK021]
MAAALLDLVGDWAWLGFVVFLRIGSALTLLPGFGEQSVPVRVKLALAFAFTAVVAPAIAPNLALPAPSLTALVRTIGTETLNGLILGFSVRLFIWMLQVAGTIAAQSTSLSQLLGAEAIDPQPAIAQILQISGLALAMIMGLHVRIAEALILSYDPLPLGQVPLASDLSLWALARVAETFGLAFTFAAPFVITSLIYNVALGVINRAMPQLMVAFVGAPAITAGGLALLLLVAPIILPIWADLLAARLSDPMGMPR